MDAYCTNSSPFSKLFTLIGDAAIDGHEIENYACEGMFANCNKIL